MTTLLIAEHDNNQLSSSTLNALAAAKAIGGPVHLLVAGYQLLGLVEHATKIAGVSKVIFSEATYLKDACAEEVAELVLTLSQPYSHILLPASAAGKNLAPRIAALHGVAQISDVTKIIDSETFERPIYAGNAIATVKSLDQVKVVTVRMSAFPAVEETSDIPVDSTFVSPPKEIGAAKVIERKITKLDRPELSGAKIIVSGGRALGSSENFSQVLMPLADKLNAAIGASRAAVDSGYVSNDLQVGQTGKIVAPNIYIAVGISGAIQHLAGMKESKIIVAINKDPEAPIFQVADVGLVADLFQAVPELVSQL